MCNNCGEQEAVFHGLCDDCRDIELDQITRDIDLDWEPLIMPFCDCEDRPCCGCGN